MNALFNRFQTLAMVAFTVAIGPALIWAGVQGLRHPESVTMPFGVFVTTALSLVAVGIGLMISMSVSISILKSAK